MTSPFTSFARLIDAKIAHTEALTAHALGEAYKEGADHAFQNHDCLKQCNNRIQELEREAFQHRGNSVTVSVIAYSVAEALNHEKPEEVIDAIDIVRQMIIEHKHMRSQIGTAEEIINKGPLIPADAILLLISGVLKSEPDYNERI